MAHIGLKIKELVEKKNCNISQLATEINISRAHIYKLFDKESIESRILEALARFFEIPVSYFFEEGKEEKKFKSKDNANHVKEAKEEYGVMLESYKVAMEALQSENDALKKLLNIKDEQVEMLKKRVEELEK